jgi:hypothetical protein
MSSGRSVPDVPFGVRLEEAEVKGDTDAKINLLTLLLCIIAAIFILYIVTGFGID